jgi:hypothetical protein
MRRYLLGRGVEERVLFLLVLHRELQLGEELQALPLHGRTTAHATKE